MADLLLPSLQQEFVSESAASLGASHRELVKALQAAADVAASSTPESGAAHDDAREQALSEAADALWRFVVQREACGFRNTELVLRDMNIPAAIRCRMGVRRRA